MNPVIMARNEGRKRNPAAPRRRIRQLLIAVLTHPISPAAPRHDH